MGVNLDPHQLKAVREMHNGCILKGGVGTGKSRTALAYAYLKELQGGLKINGKGEQSPPKTPKDIFVFTTAKKRDSKDWEGEAAQFSISPFQDSSIPGVVIRVDSWNNITDYTDVRGAFIIFDEQRLVGSGAWVKAFFKIAKNNRWIMLSATPGDTWIELAPVFIANGYFKNRSQFLEDHVIFDHHAKFPKIKKYINTHRLESYRDLVYVEMPFHRHTKRHEITMMVGFDKELFARVWKERWHVYKERPLKDIAEMFLVARKVVNSDPSRLGAIMEVLEKHPRLIVFYNYNYELEALRTLGGTLGIESKEWNGHLHQEVPDGERWLYLVQYTSGNEGWNCITTNATAFYSLNYSYKVFEQVHGRIDRMNTPFVDLYYYILRSNSAIDNAIWKAMQLKEKFNETRFMKEIGRTGD